MTKIAYTKWLLAGATAAGTWAAVPASAQPRDVRDSRDARDVRDTRDSEAARAVRYDDLPREVRRTLDDERGDRQVLGIQRVNQEGKEFYRCTVARKAGERSIRIAPGGKLLSVEDVTESDLAAFRQKGNGTDYYRDRETQSSNRESYLDKIDARVTATAQNPERVQLDDVPPRVRATFAREALGEKVDYVVRYRDNQDVIYQTNVPEGGGKVRMLQVTPDGQLRNSGEFTSGGRPVDAADYRPRTLDAADLPRGVRQAIDREYPRARVPHVDVATRRGQKIYTVELDDAGRDRYLVVNEDGKVLSDIAGRDAGR